MRRFFLIALSVVLGSTPLFAQAQGSSAQRTSGAWTLIKHEGRDYVPLNNVANFYRLGIQTVGNNFNLSTQLRSIRGQKGSKELYINNLKFILSYPIAEHNGQLIVSRMDLTKLIEPVMRPSRITNAPKITTVVLDPGHGGHDRGAQCIYGDEKTFTLDVAMRAKKMLEAQGFRVVMTRTTDVFIPLEERVKIANRYPNAILVSIHFNSSTNRTATGLETFTLAPRGVPSMGADGPMPSDFVLYPGNNRDAENIALACASHSALVHQGKMFDRGIKRARFVVIRESRIPSVLIEGGFLSNPQDARRVSTPLYRQQIATAILQAAINYRRAVGNYGESPSLPVVTNESKPKVGPVVITPSTSTNAR